MISGMVSIFALLISIGALCLGLANRRDGHARDRAAIIQRFDDGMEGVDKALADYVGGVYVPMLGGADGGGTLLSEEEKEKIKYGIVSKLFSATRTYKGRVSRVFSEKKHSKVFDALARFDEFVHDEELFGIGRAQWLDSEREREFNTLVYELRHEIKSALEVRNLLKETARPEP